MKLTFKKLKASVDTKTWNQFAEMYSDSTFKHCIVKPSYKQSTMISVENVKLTIKGKLLVIKNSTFALDAIQQEIEEVDYMESSVMIYTKDGLYIKLV